MNVKTLIEALQKKAQPTDEVFLIIEGYDDCHGLSSQAGVFTGRVIGTGTGAETGKCEIYGLD